MTRARQQTPLNLFLIFILFFVVVSYFLLLQHIYIPNMGGTGLMLPLNLIAWSMILIVSAVLLGCAGLRNKVVCSTEIRLGLLAATLMTLPLCWTPTVDYSNALPRLTAIWGALIFSLALQQIALSCVVKRALLGLVMISALLECVLSLFQWGWPAAAHQLMEYNVSRMAGRPYGIFQQPNLLASFIATGYAIAVCFTYHRAIFRRVPASVFLLLQGIMLWVLLLSGSRVGMFGALLALFLLSVIAPELRQCGDSHLQIYRQRYSVQGRWLVIMLLLSLGLLLNVAGGLTHQPVWVACASFVLMLLAMIWCCITSAGDRRILTSQQGCFAVVIVCALIFLFQQYLSFSVAPVAIRIVHNTGTPTPDLLHAGSSSERLDILKGSLSLILQHPWTGVGLGGFEAAFATIRHYPELNIASYTVTHPHNELIYVLAEGGPVAFTGLLLAAVACFLPALRALASRKITVGGDDNAENRNSLAVAVILLPIALHVLLEYPFYQSASHLLVFLLLSRISQPEYQSSYRHKPIFFHHQRLAVIPKISMIVLSVVLLLATIELSGGLKIQQQLTVAERDGLQSLPPELPFIAALTQYDRYDFDRHTQQLLQYNRSQNPQLLDSFAHWGQSYLKVHNDAGVYDAEIRIANYQGNQLLATELMTRARLSFYADRRFFINGPPRNDKLSANTRYTRRWPTRSPALLRQRNYLTIQR